MMEKDRPLRHGHPTKPPGNPQNSATGPGRAAGRRGRQCREDCRVYSCRGAFFPDGGLFSRPIFSLPDKDLLMGRRSSECRAFPVPDIFSRPDQPAESADGARKKPKPPREVLPKKGGQRDLKVRRPSSPGSRTVRSRRKRRGVPDRFPPPRRQGPGGRPDRFAGFNRCRFGILGSATLKISIRPGCSPFHRAPGNRRRCPACRG